MSPVCLNSQHLILWGLELAGINIKRQKMEMDKMKAKDI